MNWSLLGYSILLQAGAVTAIVTLVRLVRQYRLPFLRDFLVFTLGFGLFGFVIFFLQDLLLPLVSKVGDRADAILNIVTVFLLMPVTLVTLFFLFRALLRSVGRSMPGWFQWVYWFTGAAFMAATAMAVEYFLRRNVAGYLEAIYVWGFMIFNLLTICLTVAYAHCRAREIKDQRMRRLVLNWIRFLGGAFFLYYTLLMVFSDIPWVYTTLGLWFYLVIILPVAFLNRRLRRDFADFRRVRMPLADVGGRALKLGLSPRETEIVARVLAGRSNRDIENELFISQRTVKNHLYNIYRKLKIRNRVQLFRLFLDS